MKLVASNISHRFASHWVIRDFSYTFLPGEHYAIVGGNGSGKSTLLQICTTFLEPTLGSCQFVKEGLNIPTLHSYKYFSIAAPYIELVPHYSVEELIAFTLALQPISASMDVDGLLNLSYLSAHRQKEVNSLSSGMRQRVRLLLAVLADVPFVFLDEPTTNLDLQAKEWFHQLLCDYGEDKTFLIASNDSFDLQTCTSSINVESYKIASAK